MSSIIEGYNYDIFISYRQKDNKGDKWVSEFVDALKTELESTFKEEISVYFDINPHDGLLETHDVNASLKEKLKCLVFIPIISRTYCDPRSFAWEHEFKAFVEVASKDQFGLLVKLSNGNISNRVLPVRIHDLDNHDINLCESLLGGVLRGVEFVYKEPGVNRSLIRNDDERKNLNGTIYRNQLNKVALAIKETISGLKKEPIEFVSLRKEALSIEDKPLIKEKSIIVLPFENISSDPDQEYFSDGLTEEIITDLSHIHDLLVISRSSAMTFKGTKKTIPEIAQAVNVRYVLEGSVRKASNNLRITAQLIDALTDSHLWAEKYNGNLDDIFDIQEKVSRSIADSLKLKLSPDEKGKIINHPILNAKAYEYYLKARQDIILGSEEALSRAVLNIQKAMDIVGENELLCFGMGYIYFGYENVGTKPDGFYLTLAEKYASKIFEMNPESYHGYLLLGLIQVKRGKFQEVVRQLKKALAIEQNDPDVLFWLSLIYLEAGKTSAAVPLIDRLLLLDPFTPIYQLLPGWLFMMDGKMKMALEPCKKGFNINPGDIGVRYYYALILIFNNRIDEANSLIDVMIREVPDETYSSLGEITKYGVQKNRAKVLELLTQEMINFARRDEQASWIIAGCLSLIGENQIAYDWLENSVKKGCTNYPFLNEYYPFLENIRGEEQFKKLMEQVKYEWENFEE
jgi:TolB-like protein